MGVDIIFKIAGVGLLTAIVNVVLKKSDKDELATFVTLAGLAIVLIMVLDLLGGLFDNIKSILDLYCWSCSRSSASGWWEYARRCC